MASAMRTAADFNNFYAAPDPWSTESSGFRDRVFRRVLSAEVRGRNILELGCGEGHLTKAIFGQAKFVKGIDISDIAVGRAKARKLQNADFESSDFLLYPFRGYDVITAIECLYYLSKDEQEAFLSKVSHEHSGKLLIVSGPIIGENKFRQYFTHEALMSAFARHRMSVIKFSNLNIYRRDALTTAVTIATRLMPQALDWVPPSMIYQRLYSVRVH